MGHFLTLRTVLLPLLLGPVLLSCGGGGSAPGSALPPPPPPVISIALLPLTASLALGGTQAFTATVAGSADSLVNWSVVESGGGTITTTGLYTAPQATGTFHVAVVSHADSTKSAQAVVTVQPTGGSSLQGRLNLQVLDSVNRPQDLTLAKQAGASGARATPNMGWRGAEPQLGGAYTWTNQDQAILNLQNAGLEPFRIISSTRPEYNPNPSQYADRSYLLPHIAPDTGMDLWARYQAFVKAAVRRYFRTAAEGNPDAMPGLTRPVKFWSYTPEVGTYWVPIQNPVQRASDYAQMFQLTVDAIHAVDPSATLFLPFNGSPYLAAFAEGFLDRPTIRYQNKNDVLETLTPAQAATEYSDSITFAKELVRRVPCDAFDIHLYGDPESAAGQKAWVLATATAAGISAKPVWSMEGGEPYGKFGEMAGLGSGPAACGGGSEDPNRLAAQTAGLMKHVALACAAGYQSVTFNLSPEYASFGGFFGDLDLLDACYTPRPAYAALQLASQKLVPFQSAGLMAGTPANVRLVRFTFPTKADVFVAWDPAATPSSTAAHDLRTYLPYPTVRVTTPPSQAGQSGGTVASQPASAVIFGAIPVFLEPGP